MTQTIRDVLYEAATTGPHQYGGEAVVSSFPAELPELEPYMVRRIREFDPAWISYTSALTPPKHLVSGLHVGQPLLQLEDHPQYTIMPRQQGMSLRDWKKTHTANIVSPPSADSAFCGLMLDFNTAEGNPFIPFFEQSYRLGQLGYAADTLPGNIFLDTAHHKLSLVDQLSTRSDPGDEHLAQHNINKFVRVFTNMAREPLCADSTVRQQSASFNQLVEDARNTVVARHVGDAKHKVAFAKVDSVKAIDLDSPPHALVERLKRMEEQANIAR